MRRSVRRTLTVLGIAAGVLALVGWGAVQLRKPSLDRPWTADNMHLPEARFAGDSVTVRNVRNFAWRSDTTFTARWEERTYDMSRLQSVWFAVVPFGGFKGPAHTFLSFEFADSAGPSEYVAISVELRKEVGESYHPVRGLFREYELSYVVGDERDVVHLRSNVRRDSVYLYRTRTTPAQRRTLFRSMLERANALRVNPEFYNTLTSSCTTNIVDHVNAIAPNRVPRSHKVLLPAFADELAYELGLLDTTRPFAELRREALITPLALAAADAPDFPARIRAGR